MDKYQQISVVGEGSYGLVLKCKHKETNQYVAIKKFLETEDDNNVRKMALREVRMLKRLKHENLVTMIEVFRHKKRLYLVFEYLEGTILDELERVSKGLGNEKCRERIFQVTRAVNFCHMNNIIHRDIKPENVLVSSLGVVKLCDFGFARLVSLAGERCTEYVATRWYRAPELLVGESNYGAPVDVWAIGCLYAELMSGEPLFPGNSDIDQLHLTVKLLGKPCLRHEKLLLKNSQLSGIINLASNQCNLPKLFSYWPKLSLDFLTLCLQMDPQDRPTTEELLNHPLFTHDNFVEDFLPTLRENVITEFNENPLLRRLKPQVLSSTDRASKRSAINKRNELKRSTRIEPQKWKFKLEGSVKRKLSSECYNFNAQEKNVNFFNDKSVCNSLIANSLEAMIKDKINQEFSETPKTAQQDVNIYPASNIKTYSEEKISGKLPAGTTKLSQNLNFKSEFSPTHDKITSVTDLTIDSSSPPFRSLQTEYSLDKPPSRASLQHSHSILHPSISNICFCKQSPKKDESCDIFRSIQNTSMKKTFNQMPLITPPRGQIYLKKIDKTVLDSVPSGGEPCGRNNLEIAWLNNLGNNKTKKNEKLKHDEFSLPVVPGAIGSPNKMMKNPQRSPNALITQTISPERRYRKVKRKY